jgi:hypothetical protein
MKRLFNAITDILITLVTIIIFAAVIYGIYYMVIKSKQ